MAREILIKAKSIAGDFWKVGHPLHTWKGEEGYVLDTIQLLEGSSQCRINVDTICIFTGLHDSEGNKLFENDIIRTGTDEDGFKMWQIVYNKVIGQYRLKRIGEPGELPMFPNNERSIYIKSVFDEDKQ